MKIKPCPFCGGNNTQLSYTQDEDDSSFGDYEIFCDDCQSAGSLKQNEEEAIKAWNTRPEAQPVTVEKLEECIEKNRWFIAKKAMNGEQSLRSSHELAVAIHALLTPKVAGGRNNG